MGAHFVGNFSEKILFDIVIMKRALESYEPSQYHLGQPELCSVCESQPCCCEASVPSSPECVPRDDAVMLRTTTRGVATKEPRMISQEELWCDEAIYDDPEPKGVDLEVYFTKREVDAWNRIRLCRTYANYLAASVAKPGRFKKHK